jgi:hypothetical protein
MCRVGSVHHQLGGASAYERLITKVTCLNPAPRRDNVTSGRKVAAGLSDLRKRCCCSWKTATKRSVSTA